MATPTMKKNPNYPKSLYDRELEKLAGLRPLYINSGYDPEMMKQIEGQLQMEDKIQHNKK